MFIYPVYSNHSLFYQLFSPKSIKTPGLFGRGFLAFFCTLSTGVESSLRFLGSVLG